METPAAGRPRHRLLTADPAPFCHIPFPQPYDRAPLTDSHPPRRRNSLPAIPRVPSPHPQQSAATFELTSIEVARNFPLTRASRQGESQRPPRPPAQPPTNSRAVSACPPLTSCGNPRYFPCSRSSLPRIQNKRQRTEKLLPQRSQILSADARAPSVETFVTAESAGSTIAHTFIYSMAA